MQTKIKVLFIDEEKDAIDAFKDYIEDSNSDIEIQIKDSYPKSSLKDMLEFIIKENPDALITDYNLNEKKTEIKYNVGYDGAQLAQEFLKIRQYFPVFITTSYDDSAIKECDDVNIVYVKPSQREDGASRARFVDRIVQQILHYKSKIFDAERQIKELVRSSESRELDEKEERELIRLDRFLEKSIDSEFSIPDELKTLSNSRRISSLIDKVDSLIIKIEK